MNRLLLFGLLRALRRIARALEERNELERAKTARPELKQVRLSHIDRPSRADWDDRWDKEHFQ